MGGSPAAGSGWRVLRRGMVNLVTALVVGYIAALACLFIFQRSLLYLPDRSPPDIATAGASALLAPAAIDTTDGLRLLAWYRPPPVPEAPVLLHFHGNAGNIGDRVSRIGPYVAAGMGILLVEYRGFGGNGGEPSEAGLYADARAAVDFLERQGIVASRMAFYGESLGSGVAVQMATERPCAALLLEAPYSSVPEVAQHRYWMFPVRALVKDRFDSAAKVGAVRCPVLVLHGSEDRVVPLQFGQRLFAAAREPKTMKIYPGLGHVGFDEHRAYEDVLAFLRQHGVLRR